jgi:hypothetical protein
METRNYCAYNLTKDAVLSVKVTVADAVLEPFKVLEVLIGGLGIDSESSLWLTPLSSAPQVPRLFPFDMVYLDPDHRVIQGIEVAPGVDLPPYNSQVASALILPERTLSSTKTLTGDQLQVCDQSETEVPVRHTSPAAEPPSALASVSVPEPPVPEPPVPEPPVPEPVSLPESLPVTDTETIPPRQSLRRMVPDETIPIEVTKSTEFLYEFFPSPLNLIPTVLATSARTVDLPVKPQPATQIEQPAAAQIAKPDATPIEEPTPVQIAEPANLQAVTQSEEVTAEIPDAAPSPAAPPLKEILPPEDEAQHPRRKVSATPIPTSQTFQFTAAQTPIWHLSTSATAAQGKPSAETPKEKLPKEKVTEEKVPEASAPSKSASASSNQSEARDKSKPPEEKPPRPALSDPPPPLELAQAPNPLDKPQRVRGSVLPSRGVVGQPKENTTDHSPSDGAAIPNNAPPMGRSTKQSVEEPRGAPTSISRDPAAAVVKPRYIHTLPEMEVEVQQLLVKERQKKKQKAEPAKNGQGLAESISPIVEPKIEPVEPRTKKPPQKAKPKVQEKSSLTSRFQHWLDADTILPVAGPRERRRSLRFQSPGLVAYYWTGGLPRAHEVADISPIGFYLRTNAPWVLHTMVRMTLQRSDKKEGHPMHSITVLAKIVRIDPDGIGHEFVFNEMLNRNTRDILPDEGTDIRALQKFL